MMGSSDQGRPTRPSLHATFRLALLVQQVRRSLKAKVKQHRSQITALTIRESRNAARDAFSRLERDLTFENASRQTDVRGQNLQEGLLTVHRKQTIPKLLTDLKACSSPEDDRSLVTCKQNDGIFLRDVRTFAGDATLQGLSSILDITTCLLSRLKTTRDRVIQRQEEGAPWKDRDPLKAEKFLIYLEGLLRCLRQASLQALINHSLELIEADVVYWHRYSEQQKRLSDGWFTEWPGRRRPLSTTWPWNVKPSLMVLWGVCWMFYGPDDAISQASSELSLNVTDQWVPAPQRLNMNHPHNHAQPTINQQHRRRPSYGGQIPGRQPNIPVRPLPVSHARAAGLSERSWPTATATTPTPFTAQPLAGNTTFAIANNAVSPNDSASFHFQNPYISSDTAPYSFASASGWPDISGFDTTLQGYDPDFSHRQPALDDVSISPHTSRAERPPHLNTNVVVQHEIQNPSYLSPNDIPLSAVPSHNLSSPMQSSQDYPSPSSNGSAHASSARPSYPPNSISPKSMSGGIASVQSGSPTGYRRPSLDTQEPPRNAEGQIICSHEKCAKQPPVFQRKCEWTKHMDKHNRPYVCPEPGCDKIQGFTYSGGLLRHLREVHKQHGGPKTRYMCPFQDCKRSTGQGFSRKENLNEHLRRVHRGTGIRRNEPVAVDRSDDGGNDSATFGQRSGLSMEGRKRKRLERDDETEDGADDGLKREVRRLKKEALDKDRKISDLQERVERMEHELKLIGQRGFR